MDGVRNTIYIRTHDDGSLIDQLDEQAAVLGMSLNQYCLEVLKDALYPHDELITALRDRALEIQSRRRYYKRGLLPGEREVK